MKKKITNEEVGEMFAKMAQDVRDYMDYELRVAESQMWIAENDLVDALQESQHQLYRDYAEKRNQPQTHLPTYFSQSMIMIVCLPV